MDHGAFEKLTEFASLAEARERTVGYLETQLRKFLKRGERMMICFSDSGPDSLGKLLSDAVWRTGGIPQVWGPDLRWKTLLREVFSQRIRSVAAPPLIVLGLTKLAKHQGTPLSVRNVLLAGYPSMEWMIDGIVNGLDCNIWGCFGPGTGSVVSGFSCGRSRGVHIREDAFDIRIVDPNGAALPEGMIGNVEIGLRSDPSVRCVTVERARLDSTACTCGCNTPRLMDFGAGCDVDATLVSLGEMLQSWTSILDCRLTKGEYGLEMEIVTFPGEKLPRLPSCAKQIIRAWDPDMDEPFSVIPEWRNPYIYH